MSEAPRKEGTTQPRSSALETVLAEFKRLQTQIAKLDAKVERLWAYIGRREPAPTPNPVAPRLRAIGNQKPLPLGGGGARRVAPFPPRAEGTHWIVPPLPTRR